MTDVVKQLGGSKKAVATVVGILLIAFGGKLGLTQEQQDAICYLVLAYVAARGAADFGKGRIKNGARTPSR